MIIYEVNIQISSGIIRDFLTWLISHSNRMMDFDGFERYNIYNNLDYEKSFIIHYHIKGTHFLEKYLSSYLQGMKKQGKNKIGDKMNITRRVLSRI